MSDYPYDTPPLYPYGKTDYEVQLQQENTALRRALTEEAAELVEAKKSLSVMEGRWLRAAEIIVTAIAKIEELRAENEALRKRFFEANRMLRRLEFADEGQCVICRCATSGKHTHDCELAALREAK